MPQPIPETQHTSTSRKEQLQTGPTKRTIPNGNAQERQPRKRAPRLELQIPEHVLSELTKSAEDCGMKPTEYALRAVINRIQFDQLKDQNEKMIRQNGHLIAIIDVMVERLDLLGDTIQGLNTRLDSLEDSLAQVDRRIMTEHKEIREDISNSFSDTVQTVRDEIKSDLRGVIDGKLAEAAREIVGIAKGVQAVTNDH